MQWGENRQQSNTIFMRRELDELSMYAGYSKRLIWRQINKRINAVNVMENFLVQSNYMRILCINMQWNETMGSTNAYYVCVETTRKTYTAIG